MATLTSDRATYETLWASWLADGWRVASCASSDRLVQKATVFIGVIAITFIIVGRFAFNVVQSISTFAVLIVTCTAP